MLSWKTQPIICIHENDQINENYKKKNASPEDPWTTLDLIENKTGDGAGLILRTVPAETNNILLTGELQNVIIWEKIKTVFVVSCNERCPIQYWHLVGGI